ncbi:MAG TPA: polysaccharide deacetylase family protein [Longimicrobiales bacterium]|nr:polysaccharide deacetylase family protein [Longimicrobiales bacterium]
MWRALTTALAAAVIVAGTACGPRPGDVAADGGSDDAMADSGAGVPDPTMSDGTARAGRAVALTFDDLPVISTTPDTAVQWAVTRGILNALDAAGAPAIGFVNENKLGAGAARDARTRMLRAWLEAGHDLGNHSYSHPDINTTSLDAYTTDIVRGEDVTARLRGARPVFFRHPFLHAGPDSARKHGLEQFLDERGYRVAPVTIDNQEWVFARAYDNALDGADSALARRVTDAYLTYMDTIFGFYEAQARAIVGRELPQVLLLHANRINAATLDELLAMARRRGYRFITLEEALRDPAYDRDDSYIGPAGITWLHRWAISDSLDRSIFRGEPEPPPFVAEATR